MKRSALAVYIWRYVQVQIGAPTDVPPDKAKRVCAVSTGIISFLIGVALLHFDLFGYGQATERYTENFAFQIIAPFYSTARQEDITVLLLEERSLEKLNDTWPLSYSRHAEILRYLVDMRPAAIMIDILFLDNRDGPENRVDDLVGQFRRTSGDEKVATKIFLATTTMNEDDNPILKAFPVDKASPSSDQRYEPFHDSVTYSSITWENCGESRFFYPLYFVAPRDDPDVLPDDENGDDAVACYGFDKALEKELPIETSPALAIYQFLCSNKWQDMCFDRHPDETHYSDPMYVYWGSKSPRLNLYQSNKGIFCSRYRGYFYYFISRLGQRFADGYQDCPPVSTILVRDFVDESFRADPEIVKAVRNNVVFYGVSLKGVEDLVPTPNHGRVPGVYLHAAALDNLLELDREYQRPSREIWRGTDVADLVEIGMLATFVAATVVLVLLASGDRGRWIQANWQWLLITPLFWVIVAVLFFVQFAVMGVVPINALGLSAVAPLSPVMLRFLCSRKE